MSSIFGTNVHVSIFGQSHSAAIGAVVDGLPAGEPVDLERLSSFCARRAPQGRAWQTARHEADAPRILSGLNEHGRTCGAPLAIEIANTDTRSQDYSQIERNPRPGHADLTAHARWHGEQDVRGGGHFSGRLTAPIVAVGGVCLQILERRGIFVGAHAASIAGICDLAFDPVAVCAADLVEPGSKAFPVIDDDAGAAMQAAIAGARSSGDSVGGVVECAAVGMPAGVGSPMFEGLENRIAQIVFGIPAVKGIEFGAGFSAAELYGSQNNDGYSIDGGPEPLIREGRAVCATNNSGGILGGISTGMPIVFRCAFKPTPSIARRQRTIDLAQGTPADLEVVGRHDPCIVPRAVPVVEAACAIALVDALSADGFLRPVADDARDPLELDRLRALFS